MEEAIRKKDARYDLQMAVLIVCERIALIVTVLINVDLPEAFEPVSSTDLFVRMEFETALSIMG